MRGVGLSPEWGAVLYRLVRALGPRRVVELGTGAGFSGAYVVAALRANGEGSLLTVEGAPERAAVARRLLSRFGPDGWRIVVSLVEDFLPSLERATDPPDFAFIDADHIEAPVVRQVDALARGMPDGGVIVLDDLAWPEVDRAWRRARARPDCAWSAEVVRWGFRRFGVWLKGAPRPGYDGRPEVLSAGGPRALEPLLLRVRRIVPARRLR